MDGMVVLAQTCVLISLKILQINPKKLSLVGLPGSGVLPALSSTPFPPLDWISDWLCWLYNRLPDWACKSAAS